MNAIVLGMHRSGTSALTRCINLLGCRLGDELLRPSEFNPAGYFEQKRAVAINDAILETQGLAWNSLQPIETSIPLPEELQAGISDFVDCLPPSFVLKDPRPCRTLPYWKPALTRREPNRYILIKRRPEAVAQSLLARDSIELQDARRLREIYVQEAVAATVDEQKIEITFGTLLAEPVATLEEIRDFLELDVDVSRAVASLDAQLVHY